MLPRFHCGRALAGLARQRLQLPKICRGFTQKMTPIVGDDKEAVDVPQANLRPNKRSIKLHTLDQGRLSPEDFQDLSGRVKPYMYSAGHWQGSLTSPLRPSLITYCYNGSEMPFPLGTRGFFYFKTSSGVHPLACGVHFRITNDSNPASFSSGRDLLLPSGEPWRIGTLRVFRQMPYVTFREALLRDGFVSEQGIKKALDIVSSRSTARHNPNCDVIQSLNHAFVMHFWPKRLAYWTVRGDGSLGHVIFDQPVSVNNGYRYVCPFRGSALVRFELSSLPKHRNTRTLLLRIIKIVDPVRRTVPPDEYNMKVPEPKEGSLIMKRYLKKKADVVWALDVDKTSRSTEGLKMLLDDRTTAQ